MQQQSSFNNTCIKNLISNNCNCQIHECIKQIINLKSQQFNNLNKLLNLFASPYKICDQHHYPFEFFSEEENDMKCKFCLDRNSKLQLIQNMTNQETQIDLNQGLIDFPNSSDYIENSFKKLWNQKSEELQKDLENTTEIEKKWMERKKIKETIEFLKMTYPKEVHNEFHDAMTKINQIDQVGSNFSNYDVLKYRDLLLYK
ncbi:unnamed protein product [Paramecium primaurelia]|uniref:Uncharacterized protein n=1 Tax=Paramecium primaurelia TaxID=5886 RepID=A0A8S1KS88_PARPR|nr:unnamed protein product [Paramecium primaurelia]